MQLVLNIPDEVVYSSNENEESLMDMAKKKIALELFKSGKISTSQAAQLGGVDVYEFMKLAASEKIECLDGKFLDEEIGYALKVSKS